TLTEYTVDIALPGHGEMIHHLQERVQHIKKRHDQRLSQVLNVVRDGGKTAYHVCTEVYGEINKRLALSSFMATLTRLLYLESLGQVERADHDGKDVFQLTSNSCHSKDWYPVSNVTI